MQNDPKQMARKRFITFFCSNSLLRLYMKEHTKSRKNSDNQKGFILNMFKHVTLSEVSSDIVDELSIT